MNINPKIFTANEAELSSYALFHDMIKVVKAADGVEPSGACCGRNTKQIVNSFLNNKQKYFNFMENINTRLIKPLRKGVVYISPMKKMLNYELMTDNEIILCVKKGYLSDKIFDWTEYNKAQKSVEVETPAEEETPAETPAAEPTAEETPAEGDVPTEGPIEEPAESPIAEETPAQKSVEKPKRSAKKGSK